MVKRLKIPTNLQTRAAFAPSTFDGERGTVELVFTTGARGLRRSWSGTYYEELEVSEAAVDLSRLNNGASVLNAHSAYDLASVIGVVERAWLKGGEGHALIRFSDREEVQPIRRDVEAGILRHVSVGYSVGKYEKVEEADGVPVYRATRWTPAELSLVPIAFDDGAVTRNRSEPEFYEVEVIPQRSTESTMKTQPQQTAPAPEATDPAAVAERQRATSILDLTRKAKLPAQFAEDLVSRGVTIDEARAAVLDALATADEAIKTEQHVRIEWNAPAPEHTVRNMAVALASRFGGPAPTEEARQYLRLRVVDMAKHCLETRGLGTRLLSDSQVISRALGTGDFPFLLQETGQRLLLNDYNSYQGGVIRIAKKTTARDFRAVNKLRLSEAEGLELVPEHGEFKHTTKMSETKEAYTLATYGRIFALTRQALVNDDLGAFSDMTRRLGRAAAEFVAQQIVDLLTANGKMSDGLACFHATHGNLAASGAVISVDALAEAVKSMRLQKGLQGTPIDVSPKFLVVPASREVYARQAVAAITATTMSDVNPFSGVLEVVVDPRLDAASDKAWYLAADPYAFDTIEYANLEGEEAPQFETRTGFDVDGVEMRVRVDFGGGIIDHRGLYLNPGA